MCKFRGDSHSSTQVVLIYIAQVDRLESGRLSLQKEKSSEERKTFNKLTAMIDGRTKQLLNLMGDLIAPYPEVQLPYVYFNLAAVGGHVLDLPDAVLGDVP